MDTGTDEIRFEHDIESGQFEAFVGKHKAIMTYRSNREGKIFLVHTEVDEALRSKGVGEKLILHVFDYIRKNGMRMIPMCPYVKAYLKRHPEHMDIVVSGLSLS
jgi:predicted GNAT family acetyltransferase